MLTKEEREEFRENVAHGDVRWRDSDIRRLLDTCDALERERDEARSSVDAHLEKRVEALVEHDVLEEEIARLRAALASVRRLTLDAQASPMQIGRSLSISAILATIDAALAGTTGQRTGTDDGTSCSGR